jgi:non-ribosomal peptide synthetase component F
MSHEILVKEFAALYDEEKLSPLKLQYKDFALWQSNEKKKETINQQKKYWLKQFEGTIPELKLPYDFAPQSGTSYEGQSIHFNISVEDTAILKQMVLQELTTLYMLLLAVLNILMAKLCGEEDIIIGTLHDGRRHPDVQPLIGMFVNTIVLRNRPEGNKTFREFLGELTMNTFEALDNQDYPFEDILEELGINKERKSNAFIKVFFGSHDVQVSGTSSKQISAIKPSKFESRKKVITMPFDLGLGFTLSEKIYMHLDYSNDLFKQSTINKIKDYYLDILKQVMKNEQILIKDIQIQHNLIKLLSPVLSNEENDFVFK